MEEPRSSPRVREIHDFMGRSDGCVEGFVNKLKLLKRQGYGRAGFELLRARMLAA